MTTNLAALSSDIPGASGAVQAIVQKLRDFNGAETRIRTAQHRAAILVGIASQQGRTADVAKLRAQIVRLGDLATKAGQTRDKLAPVLTWLKDHGFGVVFIPVLIAVAAVSAATAIAYVLSQTALEERELDAVAAGTLTPQQYAQIRAQTASGGLFHFDLGPIVPWVLGAVALYFFGPSLLRSFTGGRKRAA